MAETIFIYDGQCGLCTRFAIWAGKRTTITFTHDTDLSHRGVDKDEYRSHAVLAGTEIYRGHLAIAHTLIAVGGVWKVCGRLLTARAISPVARRMYSLVARYRTCSILKSESTVTIDNAPAPK